MTTSISISPVVLILASVIGCTQSATDEVEASSKLRPLAQSDEKDAPSDAIKPPKAKIYDESADGLEQIAAALLVAKHDNKRVLLQFGAEWCGWCHRLHNLFESDESIAAKVKAGYVVVLIDVNGKHNKNVDAKYEHPTRFGLPVIVVLDSDGIPLTTKDTAELEEGDHHSPEKVIAFLEEWSPVNAKAPL